MITALLLSTDKNPARDIEAEAVCPQAPAVLSLPQRDRLAGSKRVCPLVNHMEASR